MSEELFKRYVTQNSDDSPRVLRICVELVTLIKELANGWKWVLLANHDLLVLL